MEKVTITVKEYKELLQIAGQYNLLLYAYNLLVGETVKDDEHRQIGFITNDEKILKK